jgi:hypothetical protein
MGDLNAYQKENPITTLEAAGFVEVSNDYSYLFDGQFGSLDYMLVKTGGAVAGALTPFPLPSPSLGGEGAPCAHLCSPPLALLVRIPPRDMDGECAHGAAVGIPHPTAALPSSPQPSPVVLSQ